MDREKRTLIIPKSRISFPHLFTKPIIDGQEGKYGARFIFELENTAHMECADKINAIAAKLIAEEFKLKKLAPDKICLREDPSRPEYGENLVLSANHANKPMVMRPGTKEEARDLSESKIYAGCYVSAKIELWAQNNKHGKRINASLIAVRFEGDGEPLDGTFISDAEAVEGFDVSEESVDDIFDLEDDLAF